MTARPRVAKQVGEEPAAAAERLFSASVSASRLRKNPSRRPARRSHATPALRKLAGAPSCSCVFAPWCRARSTRTPRSGVLPQPASVFARSFDLHPCAFWLDSGAWAGVAQLVEHHVANVVVAGSSPVTRSIFSLPYPRFPRQNLQVRPWQRCSRLLECPAASGPPGNRGRQGCAPGRGLALAGCEAANGQGQGADAATRSAFFLAGVPDCGRGGTAAGTGPR
jgi:hypothetical protein